MSKKLGLLFINIGSPLSPSTSDVKRYLIEFLTDKRIISLPYLFRQTLVRGIIAPFRASKSAKRYQQIWTDGSAPLDVYTNRLASKVGEALELPSYVTMRYRKGDVAAKLKLMQDEGIEEVLLIPLFPQYAMSSFESSAEYVYRVFNEGKYSMKMYCLAPFYNHHRYIEAIVEQIAKHISPACHLILSYHGVPTAQLKPYEGNKEKDYRYQCEETTRLVVSHPLLKNRLKGYSMVYQSRFDSRKWLSPILSKELAILPQNGTKDVIVFSPTFICDCLETLEEIGIMGAEIFHQAGGEKFTFIPAPNDNGSMVDALTEIISTTPATPLEKWISPR